MIDRRRAWREPHDLTRALHDLLGRLSYVRTLDPSDPQRIAWVAEKEQLVAALQDAGSPAGVPEQRR